MITRVEAREYRCFRSVSQDVGPFEVLVGPNGSGKSVFLDIVSFLSTFMSSGLVQAVEDRSLNFHDLVWRRQGSCFELAIEARNALTKDAPTVRYALGVKLDPVFDSLVVNKEQISLLREGEGHEMILSRDSSKCTVRTETSDRSEATFEIKGSYSALGHLDDRFPSAVWLRELLQFWTQVVLLDNKALRNPSPPGQHSAKMFDGSTLARLVFQLQEHSQLVFDRWVAHLRTALPDLDTIKTISRPEDKTRYLMLGYKNGVEAPSWVVSDGTLRLLALTILAYRPQFKGVYLIEEPENGVHPTALETIFQSLSSVYDSQIMTTSHSPVLLGLPRLDQLLCFNKTEGGTEILRGDRHPLLQDWKGGVNLGDLFAAGVLG